MLNGILMEVLYMECGVRLNSRMYFNFNIDPDNGDILVRGEIILDDGTVVEPVGSVVWEEGE